MLCTPCLLQVSEMKAEYFPPKVDIILQNEIPTDFYILVTGALVLHLSHILMFKLQHWKHYLLTVARIFETAGHASIQERHRTGNVWKLHLQKICTLNLYGSSNFPTFRVPHYELGKLSSSYKLFASV